MSRSKTLLLVVLVVTSVVLCHCTATAADEKKPEKKKEPPRVVVVVPLGMEPGRTNRIKIRGVNLTNATELRFSGLTNAEFKIKSSGKADVPKDQDAKKSGDTQLEVELKLAEGTPAEIQQNSRVVDVYLKT